jgi:uncharacterized membrane protein
MTKKEFVSLMKKELSGLSKAERDDILMEYEVHFAEGVKSGKTEERIAKELGSPRELSKMYKVGVLIQEAEENVSTNNIIRAILASVGLGLFNLILVLGPFVAIVGVIVGIFGASIGLVVAGLTLFAYAAFGPFGATWLSVPGILAVEPLITGALGVGFFALGLLIFILGVTIGRLIYQLTTRYLRFNLKMIKGK